MNRNKLKAYAPQARRDFIKAVTDRAAYYGLTKDKVEPITEQGDVAIIAGRAFPGAVAAKRKRLEERIRRQGFDQVMEAMAYTWFNRFVAIRFMELHSYLDHGYRVLSTTNHTNDTNERRRISRFCNDSWLPEILEYGEHVDLPGVDQDKVVELKLAGNKDEELYRMLLIAQCNALHKAMPFLFEWINDATELLLPENLLHSDSLIRKLVNEIPEEEWQEVEIIGWLYQFYISEKKDQVIGKVVKSEDIPAATQLFTPNWIVKYMVQNTMGRQWMATYPNSSLKQQMEFYIEPAEQTPEVQEQLKAITPDSLNPEELTLLDPACGSGHILVEAYDLLKAIYQERGYRKKDITRLILEKNLYGLEIDDRSAQLAAFALMMKARADDRHIFENGTQPHVLAIQESKGLDAGKMTESLNEPILKVELLPREFLFEEMEEERAPLFSRKNLSVKGDIRQADVAQLIDLFENGKTFGSLIRVPGKLAERLSEIAERVEDVLAYGEMFGQAAAMALKPIVKQTQMLAQRYDAVVTNPPYMGRKTGMNSFLQEFGQSYYPKSKYDLYAMFIERCLSLCADTGFVSMITMHSWMFLSSFEGIRESILNEKTLFTLAHLGPRAFSTISGEVVQTATFCLLNCNVALYKPTCFRLLEGEEKTKMSNLLRRENGYINLVCDEIKKIPGRIIAYWASKNLINIFEEAMPLSNFAEPRQGMATSDNNRFLRFWFEVAIDKIGFSIKTRNESVKSRCKWFPYNKGGKYRKWYGNNEYVVNWEDDGREILEYAGELYGSPTRTIKNIRYYFRDCLTWSAFGNNLSMRMNGPGFLFDTKGQCLFLDNENEMFYYMALLNSKVATSILKILAPTLDFNSGTIARFPVTKPQNEKSVKRVINLSTECYVMSKNDWDFLETSWDFQSFPMMRASLGTNTVEQALSNWEKHCVSTVKRLQDLETTNNRLLIEAYGMQDQLSPEVPESQITLYSPERPEDIKRLISYAIGCMMGRYSLNKPGLIYAQSGNQGFDSNQYKTFPADEDGIIPITDTAWFPDDAPNRVVEFIRVAWPKEHLEENLKFIAESLGPNHGESPRDTIRRYLSTGFYKHHLSMYKKRPIYWLFSSGKQRAFQCLVYLHRYSEGTLSRMRTEYVIPLQGKIGARIDHLEADSKAATSTSHRKKLERERDKLVKQQAELLTFDEKLRHHADQRISLDLDDGVKVNYGKFGDLLAEIKSVTGKKTK